MPFRHDTKAASAARHDRVLLLLELTRVKIIAERLGNDPRAGKLWAWPAVLPCGRAHELHFVLHGCFLLKS